MTSNPDSPDTDHAKVGPVQAVTTVAACRVVGPNQTVTTTPRRHTGGATSSRPPGANSGCHGDWNIAGELCRRAAAIIDEAGAATDARARRRLLAATTHLTRSVVLGQWVPAYQEELDNELLQALKDTEQGPD